MASVNTLRHPACRMRKFVTVGIDSPLHEIKVKRTGWPEDDIAYFPARFFRALEKEVRPRFFFVWGRRGV